MNRFMAGVGIRPADPTRLTVALAGVLGVLLVATAVVILGAPGSSGGGTAVWSPQASAAFATNSAGSSQAPGASSTPLASAAASVGNSPSPASPAVSSPAFSSPSAATAQPRHTQPPDAGRVPGDHITNPIIARSLPFEYEADGMPLGRDSGQPECFEEGKGEVIWFAYTPDRRMKLRAAADLTSGLYLYAGSLNAAGTLDVEVCDEEEPRPYIAFEAAPGNEYLFMVRVSEYDERQFALRFVLDEFTERPPGLAVFVDPGGNVDPDGRAWFSGWVSCSAPSPELYLSVRITDQRAVEGDARVPLDGCSDDRTTWRATVTSHADSGPFTPGPASVVTRFSACDGSHEIFCTQISTQESVTLAGHEDPPPEPPATPPPSNEIVATPPSAVDQPPQATP